MTLECEVSEPNRCVAWYKDGVEIKDDDKRTKRSSAGSVHSLTIRKTCMEDAGEYSARIGEEVTKAKLVVEQAVATIKSPLADVSVPLSQNVVLSCELSKPNRKVSWYKNGTEIKPSDRIVVETSGTKQTLTVKKCTKHDAGEFTCRIGEEETKAKVTIAGKLKEIHIWAVLGMSLLKIICLSTR